MNQLSYQFFDIKEETRTIHDLRSNYLKSKFGEDGYCAFDKTSFLNKQYPKIGDLLEIKFFRKGRGFVGSEKYVVMKTKVDNRPGSEIESNPYHSCQLRGGHAGKKVHRVLMRIEKY